MIKTAGNHVIAVKQHTHEGNVATSRARTTVIQMKMKMTDNAVTPRAAQAAIISQLSGEVKKALPDKNGVARVAFGVIVRHATKMLLLSFLRCQLTGTSTFLRGTEISYYMIWNLKPTFTFLDLAKVVYSKVTEDRQFGWQMEHSRNVQRCSFKCMQFTTRQTECHITSSTYLF